MLGVGFRVPDIRGADSGVKRYLASLCLACCTKLFRPLFRVSDIRFSKCSVQVSYSRTQTDYIRHRGSSNPCLDIVSKHCWELNRPLRKSNILHQSQMPK